MIGAGCIDTTPWIRWSVFHVFDIARRHEVPTFLDKLIFYFTQVSVEEVRVSNLADRLEDCSLTVMATSCLVNVQLLRCTCDFERTCQQVVSCRRIKVV